MGRGIRLIWTFLGLTLLGAILSWQTALSSVHSTGALYVAPTGSDSNDCRSLSAPCRTITAATRKGISGETIYVAAGTYSKASGEIFPIQLPSRVSLVGDGPESTIIQGISDEPVVYIEGTATPVLSDTVISGLTFVNGDIGLYLHAINGQTLSPSLTNLHLTRNRVGLLLSTSGDYDTMGAFVSPVISNTQVFSNTETGIAVDAYTFIDPCAVSPTIINSVIRNNGGDGLFLGATAIGNTYCSAAPHIVQTSITDNEGNGINSAVVGYGTTQPIVERSTIIGNKGWGIRWRGCWGFGPYPRPVVMNSIIARNQEGGVFVDEGFGEWRMTHATVVDNEKYGIYYRTRQSEYVPFVRMAITNTIIWNSRADDLAGGPWSTENIRFSAIEDGDFAGQEGNISADPLLTPNYRLSACSPAINAGAPSGAPDQDIDGEPRPMGAGVDIGADEYEAPCWLSLSKEVSETRAQYGTVLTYTIQLTNTTALTPVHAALTDSLPPVLVYQPDSLRASQGEASYADGRITWAETLAPGNTVTITFQTRVQRANTWAHNWAIVDTDGAGTYVRHTETWVDPASVYLPFVRQSPSGIYGRVTFNGDPPSFIALTLHLRFYDGSSWSTLAVTSTDYEGKYVFKNVPPLGPGQMYYVCFYNFDDPRFLYFWGTRILTSYAGSADMGTFDIANIQLLAPSNGATVGLPYTFRWQPRPATPSDTYEFNLYDPYDRNVYFYTPPLGYVGSYTLTGLPDGFSPGKWYVWEVWIYSPDGGFGISREARWVKFSNAARTKAEEIPSLQPRPGWWIEEDWIRK